MVERPKHRQSNTVQKGSSDNRREYLSGSWFEWLWVTLVFAAMFSVPVFMPDFQDDGPWPETLWGLVILCFIPLACEVSQYAVMRSFGARPKFDWFRFSWRSALGSPWTARDHRFTAEQFATVCQRPFLVVLALTALYVVIMPANGWWLLSLVLYAATEARRMWFSLLSLRQPSGTLIEEAPDGTVVHRPDAPAPC